MRNKEKSDGWVLEKVCSLLNNTGSLFPSAGCCHVWSGMAGTVVASCGYDSNNIGKWQDVPSPMAPELVCLTNRNGRNDGVILKIRLWKTLRLPSWASSFSWITHSGESQLPCHEDNHGEAHRARSWGLKSWVSCLGSGSLSPKWQ